MFLMFPSLGQELVKEGAQHAHTALLAATLLSGRFDILLQQLQPAECVDLRSRQTETAALGTWMWSKRGEHSLLYTV